MRMILVPCGSADWLAADREAGDRQPWKTTAVSGALPVAKRRQIDHRQLVVLQGRKEALAAGIQVESGHRAAHGQVGHFGEGIRP